MGTSIPPGLDALAQEVFARLLRCSDESIVENPQHHLFQIEADVVDEWRKRDGVREPHDESRLEERLAETNATRENIFARIRKSDQARAMVDRLPTRQRELLLLHVNKELTCKQIAERRNLPHSVVVRDLAHAYTTLSLQLRI